MTTPRRLILFGTYGELLADAGTGAVIECDAREYADITRLDVDELASVYGTIKDRDEFDILDCGFWTDQGRYYPPEPDHR